MHWIEVTTQPDGNANCQWNLRKRILGSVPVEAESIDHEGVASVLYNIFFFILLYSIYFKCFAYVLLCLACGGNVATVLSVGSCLHTVVTQLAKAELEKYNLTGWWPTFVTDAGGNVQRAFKGAGSTRVGGMADWSRCCCHLLHNVVKHGLSQLSLRAPTTQGCRTLKEALDR